LVTRLADIFTRKPLPAVDATPLAQARQPERQQRLAEAVRAVLAEQAAGLNGAARQVMEVAASPLVETGTTLWSRVLRFDAADPAWADRDRVVLARLEHAPLIRAILDLTGIEGPDLAPSLDPIFAPPAQALAFAVGQALAERMMAARFGKSLVDHRTWLIATPADLAGGLSYEAATLASDLKLAKLAIIVDDTPPASAAAVAADDCLERFAGWGWATKRVGAQDPAAIAAAFTIALRARKPLVIACRKPALGQRMPDRPISAPMIPEEVRDAWKAAGARNTTARRGWLKRLARHAQAADFERVMNSRLPDGWRDIARAERARLAEMTEPMSPLAAGHRFVQAMAAVVPDLVGAAATMPVKQATAPLPGAAPLDAGDYGGRHIAFGTAATAMPGVLAGVSCHGGLTVVAETSAAEADCLPQTIRPLAREGRRMVHVLVEQHMDPAAAAALPLASLRAIPNLQVFRPACAVETAECWELALQREDGPSVMLHSARAVRRWREESTENACARGGYVAAGLYDARAATLIASGAELAVALQARALLADIGILVAVVSLPCWSLFANQNEAYRADVLGEAPRLGVEAGSDFGWGRWLGAQGQFIGPANSGLMAARPGEYSGITPEALVIAVKKKL